MFAEKSRDVGELVVPRVEDWFDIIREEVLGVPNALVQTRWITWSVGSHGASDLGAASRRHAYQLK